MSDTISYVDILTAQGATKSVYPISMARKRNPVFSLHLTAHSSGAADESLIVKVYGTNAEGAQHATAAFWLLLITFTTVNNASAQNYMEIKTIQDHGAIKQIPLYAKIEYTIAGTTPSFTGYFSISNQIAVVA